MPEDESLGHVLKFPRPSFRPDIELKTDALHERVMALYAGVVAEKRVRGRYNWAGASGDVDVIGDLLLRAVPGAGDGGHADAALRHLNGYLLASTELAVTYHWPRIEAVAAALLERKTLTGREVRDIIAAWWNEQAEAAAQRKVF